MKRRRFDSSDDDDDDDDDDSIVNNDGNLISNYAVYNETINKVRSQNLVNA